MSYILDALRRADAERERGEVPGLQSQQHAMLDDDDAAPRSRPMVWVIVALVVALAAAIAWNFVGGEPPRSPASAGLPPPVAPPLATPAAPMALPAATSPLAAIASAPVIAAVAVPSRPAASAAPPAIGAEPRKTPVRKVAPAPATIAAASANAPASAARVAADSRVVPFSELPDAVRRDLPKLAFGGSSYSGSASSRMVILNGQVFHEGDAVAPGLTLRQIKPKAAVLSFRDVRFEMSY